MKFHAILLLALCSVAVAMLVRAWFKPEPNYIGWVLLAIFSTLGTIAAL